MQEFGLGFSSVIAGCAASRWRDGSRQRYWKNVWSGVKVLVQQHQKLLVEGLLLCGSLRSSMGQRNDIVSFLPIEIGSRIDRANDAVSDLNHIVTRCYESGAISQLLAVVEAVVGDTIAVKELKQLWAKLRLALLIDKGGFGSAELNRIFVRSRPRNIETAYIPSTPFEMVDMLWQMSRDRKPVAVFAVLAGRELAETNVELKEALLHWCLEYVHIPGVAISIEDVEALSDDVPVNESHLMVVIKPSLRKKRYILSAYLWQEPSDYRCLFLGLSQSFGLDEIPKLLVDQLARLPEWPEVIEFLLPFELLNQKTGSWEMELNDDETGLFFRVELREYFVTIARSLERHEAAMAAGAQRRKIGDRERLLRLANKAWKQKWHQFHMVDQRRLTDRFHWIVESGERHDVLRRRLLQSADRSGVVIAYDADIKLLATMVYAGIPIVLWPQVELVDQNVFCGEMRQLFQTLSSELPQSLHELQNLLIEEDQNVVHRLMLLWDDPERTLKIAESGTLL